MECQKTADQTAYPVFYDVEPFEVRKQLGAIGEAFAKHKNDEVAGKWREALKEAADLAGWELKTTAHGHEATFIKRIVEEICLRLHSIDLDVTEKLIGMETRIKEIDSSLEIGFGDVRMIGFKGIGGAGKTTLARAIFDKIGFQFEGKSFVENVREISNGSLPGLKSLQEKVLHDVLNEKGVKLSNVHDGKSTMKRMLSFKKVLVVLDDVDHLDQLEALAGEPKWFKPGSRIIITTRDEQVLIAHRVKWIHNVNLLSEEEALCLFSRYSFGRDIPIEGFEELSKQVVRYAAGLPLTIRVLGSFLCSRNELDWADALERLKTIPLKETLEKLEVSYIGLEDDYKEIFLDIACFLKGWPADSAVRMLESCGFYARNGLRVLAQKSLITIDRFQQVEMHDHIQELGSDIVRRLHPDEPSKHSRLWIQEDVEEVLGNDLGTKATKCIELSGMQLNPEVVMKGLRNMKKLRYLMVKSHGKDYHSFGEMKLDQVSEYFPNALRYISWYHYPFQHLPKTFRANNLVALQMGGSRIVQLWEGGARKVLNKLRFLDLSNSALTTLDLDLMPNIEMLHLYGCDDLVELHAPVRCLRQVNFLDLGDSPKFLPLLFMRRLESLEVLPIELHLIEEEVPSYFNGWEKNRFTCYYKELPSTYETKLKKFLTLRIQSSTKLFSQTSYNLGHLKKLKFKGSITEVPEEISQLECLEELSVLSTKVRHLPDSICSMKQLKFLEILDCHQLESLPENLGHIKCLEKLSLSCKKVKHLPDSICMLENLKSLDLNYLEKLPDEIGRVEHLEELSLFHTNMKSLPHSIYKLKQLKALKLKWFWCLEELSEDLGRLECLDKLELCCRVIKHFPSSIVTLKHLKSLKLEYCWKIENLPKNLGQLECLEELCLQNLQIYHLPKSICKLKHLRYLYIDTCWFLRYLPKNLGRIERLETLIIKQCHFLVRIPNSICKLKCLSYFLLNSCSKVQKLPNDLGRLASLQELNVKDTYISHLPQSISLLKGLRIVASRSLLESFDFATDIQTSEKNGTFCYI